VGPEGRSLVLVHVLTGQADEAGEEDLLVPPGALALAVPLLAVLALHVAVVGDEEDNALAVDHARRPQHLQRAVAVLVLLADDTVGELTRVALRIALVVVGGQWVGHGPLVHVHE
jgi:hypothetical protein